MQEQNYELFSPSKSEIQKYGVSDPNNNYLPCHSEIAESAFRGPFSIRAILSSPTDPAETQLPDEEIQDTNTTYQQFALESDWEVSPDPSWPHYFKHMAMSWSHPGKHQGMYVELELLDQQVNCI